MEPKNTYLGDVENTCKMSTKLTLTVEKQVIERAKRYAKQTGRSLSNIVEEYLKALVAADEMQESADDEFEISPLVASLWGSVKAPGDLDYKDLLEDELAKKYLK